MDKQQLSRLRKLNKEAKDLKSRIDNLAYRPKEWVSDSVKDYSTGYPRTVVIEGYGDEEYARAKDKLYNQYVRKLLNIQREIDNIEQFLDSIDDPEMRTILRLYYISGLTQEQIADKMGYSRETIKRRLRKLGGDE